MSRALEVSRSRFGKILASLLSLPVFAGAADAQFPPIIQLPTFPNGRGLEIDGTIDAYLTGSALGSAGDLDADGKRDLVVGAWGAVVSGMNNAGSTWVIRASPSLATLGTLDLGTLNGPGGFALPGLGSVDLEGYSVSSAGDLNGDGIEDLLVAAPGASQGNRTGKVYVVFGGAGIGSSGAFDLSSLNGTNGFEIRGTQAGGLAGQSVARLGDFNGDGVDDILIGAPFVSFPAQTVYVSNDTWGTDHADVDGDGDEDLVITSPGLGSFTIFTNQGAGLFGMQTFPINPHPSQVAFRDLDGDGDPDLIFSSGIFPNGGIEIVKNTGNGQWSAPAFYPLPEVQVRFAAGDMDGDGDVDVVAVDCNPATPPSGNPELHLLRNSGSGALTVEPGIPVPYWPFHIATADLDGDGDLDVVVVSKYLSTVELYENDGAGHFTHHGSIPLGAGAVDDLVVADLDGDGRPDIAGPQSYRIRVLWNAGGFSFGSPVELPLKDGSYGLVVGDLDGDGKPDLVTCTESSYDTGQINVVMNLGNRAFATARRLPAPGNAGHPSLVDLNGDHRLDFFAATGTDAMFVLGNGDGTFQGARSGQAYVLYGHSGIGSSGVFDLSTLDGTNGFTMTGPCGHEMLGSAAAGLGDWNGDGYADFVVGSPDSQSGGFDAGTAYVVFGGPAIGPYGDLDLLSLDGHNGFAIHGDDTYQGIGGALAGGGDVNGDGRPDLVAGAPEAPVSGQAETGAAFVLYGRSHETSAHVHVGSLDGARGFRFTGSQAGDRLGSSVALGGDLNGDGFGDIALGATGADRPAADAGGVYVVFGRSGLGSSGTLDVSALQGTDGFAIQGELLNDSLGGSCAWLPDLDGDGRNDLVVGAPGADFPGQSTRQGKAYVLFGIGSTPPGIPFCAGDGTLATQCPCGNFGASGRGCANSIVGSTGSLLASSGTTTPDTVVLSGSSMLPSALCVFFQGTSQLAAGATFGDGLRCTAGTLKRLGVKTCVEGAAYYPGAGDLPITQRSAALGDPIPSGGTRYYQVYYRDPNPAFCAPPLGSTWNVTNGVIVTW